LRQENGWVDWSGLVTLLADALTSQLDILRTTPILLDAEADILGLSLEAVVDRREVDARGKPLRIQSP
jgi:hypothetical protein